MRCMTFARRNAREILRDPLNLFFGLGFPVVILLLLTAIQANVPVQMFGLEQLAPGITVFALSFLSLFSGALIARDRSSALLQRLYTTPLTAVDFILGYLLPMIPIALTQCLICYAVALVLGLVWNWNILLATLFLLPTALLFIGLGLLCGSVFTDKQVGGVCGSLLTNLTAFLSGTWFDLELVGKGFRDAANLLPFAHAVELERAVLRGDFSGVGTRLAWVLGYAVVILTAAVVLFLRQMRKQ